MKGAKRRLGRAGERVAARYLKRRGLRIIARNWHCPGVGEADIVARDGDGLVIVEVRTRSIRAGQRSPFSPEASIGPAKVRRLHRLAEAFARQQRWRPTSRRVDIVAAERRGMWRWTLRWHRGVEAGAL